MKNIKRKFDFIRFSTIDIRTIIDEFTPEEYSLLLNNDQTINSNLFELLQYHLQGFLLREEYEFCIVIRDFVYLHEVNDFFVNQKRDVKLD